MVLCANITAKYSSIIAPDGEKSNNLSRNDIVGITKADSSVTQMPLDEFYKQSTYEAIGWDFNTVWEMPEDGGFPILQGLNNQGGGSDDGSNDEDDEKSAIIVIPGITGSELEDEDELIWLGFVEGHLKKLELDDKGDSINKNIKVSDNYGPVDTYKHLVTRLESAYGSERDVYFFPYDWRVDNVDTAKKLEDFIKEKLENSKVSKVDIVAHSMGGLVASRYIANGNGDKIRKFISLGTPYLGSPKVPYVLATGHLLEIGTIDFFSASVPISIAPGSIKKLTPHMTTAYQLLPYNSPHPYIAVDSGKKEGFRSIFYEQSDGASYIKDNMLLTTFSGEKVESGVKGYFLNNAKNFMDGIHSDGVPAIKKVDYHVIIGVGERTIKVTGMDKKGEDVLNLWFEDGDGTVPVWSANINDSVVMVDKFKENHTGLVKNDEVIDHVIDILDGNQDLKDIPNYGAPYTVIRIACPVDAEVTRNGETLASAPQIRNTETSFGELYLVGHDEEIKIFALDAYDDFDVEISGTDTGTMDYSIQFFDANNELVEERVFENVPITDSTSIKTDTNQDGDTILSVDTDGNGTVDYTLESGDNSTKNSNPSIETDILSIAQPSNAVISSNGDITASVANTVTTQAIDVTVSPGASWKLYNDAAATGEISSKQLTLSVGENKAYIKVTAEDGTTSKTYNIIVNRAEASSAPEEKDQSKATSLNAAKTKTTYTVGDMLGITDLTVTATYTDSTSKTVTGYTTNAAAIDMGTAGKKTLSITYTENGVAVETAVNIQVNAKNKPEAAKTYTIIFDANGGTAPSKSKITITQDSAIGTLPGTGRSGYTFKGWYTARTGGSKVENTTKPTASQILYAQWGKVEGQEKTYTVKFNANGGKKLSISKRNVEGNKRIGKTPTVQKKGYVLKGWYTKKSGGSRINSKTKITKNQTLYARWSKVAKPKKAKAPTLKNSKSKQLFVSYKKTSGAKGYEIVYSTSKKFTKSTTKKTTSTTLKKTIKKLKKGKTYYVKIRAYKVDSARNKVYGSYSKVKSVEIKK
ncbi:InlB B-repeat-containing protein [Lachnospiraceae bacterium ZAX-1]